MWKLPIKTYRKPTVTQVYGETKWNTWYQSVGVDIPHHNGTDFGIGTPVQTYGTPLVSPWNGKVVKVTFSEPISTKGNGVTIESDEILEGELRTKYQVVFWHTGEVRVRVGDKLAEGDVVCYIGNSGICNPLPTPDNPFQGSHLHLMLYKYYWQGGWKLSSPANTIKGESDPLQFFDKNQWWLAPDSGKEHDLEPLKWAWTKLGITDMWIKILSAWRWFNS